MIAPERQLVANPGMVSGFMPPVAISALPGMAGPAADHAANGKPQLTPQETDAFLKAFSQALRQAAAEPHTRQFRETLLEAQKQDSRSRNAAMAEANYRVVFDAMLAKHLRKQLPALSDKTTSGRKYMQAMRTSLGIYHTTRHNEATLVLRRIEAERAAKAAKPTSSLRQSFAAAGKALVLRQLDKALHGTAKLLINLGSKVEAMRPAKATPPAPPTAPVR